MDSISASLSESSKKSNMYVIHEKNSGNEKVCVITVTPHVLKNIFGKDEAEKILVSAKAKNL